MTLIPRFLLEVGESPLKKSYKKNLKGQNTESAVIVQTDLAAPEIKEMHLSIPGNGKALG